MNRSERMMLRKATEFINLREELQQVTARKEQTRDWLKQRLQNSGYVDHDGNQWFDLPDGYGEYRHLKNEKKVSTTINVERLKNLALDKGVEARVIRKEVIEVIDQDEIYVLYQENIITEEELDSLFDEKVTYALNVVK